MSRGQILYIEDNFDNRILIKRVLEAEGYTVIEAENGKTGIEKATSSAPDLILMDINLPDIDGYECTARLRKLMNGASRTPIVALTANVMEGDSQKALDAGCDGHIPKPIDVDTLPVQVAGFIKKTAEPAAADKPAADKPAAAVPAADKPAPAAPPAVTPASPVPSSSAPATPPASPAAPSSAPAAPQSGTDKPATEKQGTEKQAG